MFKIVQKSNSNLSKTCPQKLILNSKANTIKPIIALDTNKFLNSLTVNIKYN